ncbi:MAG: pyridoxal-phosphate dependent enzyme [Alphaproteobacteria bacterium]|nr:pyridoxal-phosphate dependent enzyme [Alphaproteobacteria bacterium]
MGAAMRLPTPAGIRDALALVRRYLPLTPLYRSELLSAALGADVWLKVETVSPIASFKLRGASVDIARARARGAIRRIVTSSTGNHGQGVAYAARLLGIGADVFLPAQANPLKAATIAAFGATLHRHGADNNVAKAEAQRFAAAHGHHFVDDGESVDLMEGAGTVGLEIVEALADVDRIYVPVGDGALLGGSACAAKSIQPRTRVIGVQAEGAPALTLSYHARRAIEHPVATIADGLASRTPAALALAALWQFVDDATVVSDDDLLAAIHSLAESAHVLVEPAGAAALAGAWSQRQALAGQRIVLVLTGANVTIEVLRRALNSPALFTLATGTGNAPEP